MILRDSWKFKKIGYDPWCRAGLLEMGIGDCRIMVPDYPVLALGSEYDLRDRLVRMEEVTGL